MELPEGAYWAIGPAESAAEPQTDTAAAQKDARLVTAGTLEELAEAMGADADVLRQAVESYNAVAPEGERLETGDYAAEWRTPVLAETLRGHSAPMSGALCCGRTAVCCRGSTLWGQLPPVWRTTAPNCGRRRNGRCSCPDGLCAPPWACRTSRRRRLSHAPYRDRSRK
ncbi:MAG: hypothetical protein V8Q30_09835 [Acutalibacteraceae bacterium]